MKVVEVVAAVIRRRGRVLICDRPASKPPAGWEFPGGKVEPGERPGEALRRELDEELGIRAVILDPVFELTHAYPDKTVRLLFFRTVLPAGTEPRPREGQHCRWIAPAELTGCGLLEADRPLAEFLR